jgi:hypothetical protein
MRRGGAPTSMRPAGGGAARGWLWAAVTAAVSVFLVRRSRGRAVLWELVGPTPGVITSDRYPVYDLLAAGRRQVCWAHLRRDSQAMIDRVGPGAEVGDTLLLPADILLRQWKRVRDGTLSRTGLVRHHLGWLRDDLRAELRRGAACGCAKAEAVCRELLHRGASRWTFAAVGGSRRTTRRNGRCGTRCVGGRPVTGRTGKPAAASWSACSRSWPVAAGRAVTSWTSWPRASKPPATVSPHRH